MNSEIHRFRTFPRGAISTDSLADRKKDRAHSSWLGWTAVGLGLLILNAPAGAQDAASAKTSRAASNVLEEVVVTARQREEGVQSVPIPISAISGATLADQAAFDITDITRLAPNLQINIDAQTKTATSVFLRGIGQTNASPSSDPKVAIYLDGVYVARPVGTVFDLVDVARVEVLRGPQGTLFGRNTTAGLIHIIHNQPEPEFDASVRVMAGNDGQLTYSGMVNLPLTDTLAARFSGQHREDDGYTENTFTGEDWNDKDADTLRGALLWSPSDDFSAELAASYDRTREHPNLVGCEWGAPENGADVLFPPGPLSAIFIYGQYDQNRDNCNASGPYQAGLRGPAESQSDAYGAAATLEWDLGFAQLTSITAWREVESGNTTSSFSPASSTVSAFDAQLWFDPDDQNESDQWSQELRLAGTAFGERLDWTAGVYAFEENGYMQVLTSLLRDAPIPTPEQSPIFYAPTPIGFPTWGAFAGFLKSNIDRYQSFETNNRSWAVFGEGVYHFTDQLALTAGFRYSEDDKEFIRTQTTLDGLPNPRLRCPDGESPPDGISCKVDQSYRELTPRLIISYNITDDVMVYGGWSKGFSSGGFNQSAAMSEYEPETASNWEAGVKSSWFQRRLIANVTGFYNEYEEQQIQVERINNGSPSSEVLNAQQVNLYGIEAEVSVIPFDGLLITGSYGWLDGKYDEFTVTDTFPGSPPDFTPTTVERDLSDTGAVKAPPYTYNINAEYTHYLTGGSSITGGLGWSYRGRSYNNDLEDRRTVRQDGYGLLNGRLNWRLANGKTSISLWGTNLLDEEYFTHAADFSSLIGIINKGYGPTRRYGIEISHRFGAE